MIFPYPLCYYPLKSPTGSLTRKQNSYFKRPKVNTFLWILYVVFLKETLLGCKIAMLGWRLTQSEIGCRSSSKMTLKCNILYN